MVVDLYAFPVNSTKEVDGERRLIMMMNAISLPRNDSITISLLVVYPQPLAYSSSTVALFFQRSSRSASAMLFMILM
jgi:hypothetical protein